jgi:hypothetical protein
MTIYRYRELAPRYYHILRGDTGDYMLVTYHQEEDEGAIPIYWPVDSGIYLGPDEYESVQADTNRFWIQLQPESSEWASVVAAWLVAEARL